MEQARVPSAGLVWWKAELRARREAVRVASRPITLVTGVAIAFVLAAIAFLVVGYSKDIDMATVSAFVVARPMVLWIALAVILAATPIALYFVSSDE